jgi:hypothetical protein
MLSYDQICALKIAAVADLANAKYIVDTQQGKLENEAALDYWRGHAKTLEGAIETLEALAPAARRAEFRAA